MGYILGLYRDNGQKMETTIRVKGLGFRAYSPPSVDRIWGIWGSYNNVPKAIFCVQV